MRFSPAEQIKLIDLQEMDSALAKIRHEIKNLPAIKQIEQINIDGKQITAQLAEVDNKLTVEQEAMTRLEEKIQKQITLCNQRKQAQASGEGITSKGLLDLEHEIGVIQTIITQLEDDQIAQMEVLEALTQTHTTLEQELIQIKEQGLKAQAEAKAEHERIMQTGRQIQAQRDTLANSLPGEILKIYDRARAETGIGARALQTGTDIEILPLEERILVQEAEEDELIISEELGCILVRK